MPPPEEPSWLDRFSPLGRQIARIPAAVMTAPLAGVGGAAKLAARETAAQLPTAVQQWIRQRMGLPPGVGTFDSPIGKAADEYRKTIQDRYWSDAPFMEKAQKSAQDVAAGLWSLGENLVGFHDYPGDDRPVEWTPSGLLREVSNFSEGRTENVANLGAGAAGVPASMAAGLASDIASRQNRVLSGDPVGVAATFAPVAARGFRAARGKFGGPEIEARSLGGEPLTTPLSEPTRGYVKPRFTELRNIPVETPLENVGKPFTLPEAAPSQPMPGPVMGSLPVPRAMGATGEALAARVLPVAKAFVSAGLVNEHAAAAAMQSIVPWKTAFTGQAVKSAANTAVRMAKGAAVGMAVAGDPLGATGSAIAGALAPEAVRLFWRALSPETQASVVRKIGGRGARYQQATPEETEFARQVIEGDHAAAEGMGALGQAAAGEYLRSRPVADLSARRVKAPEIYTRLQDVVVTPEGEIAIARRARAVEAAAPDALELEQRRAEVEAIPPLRETVQPTSPADIARMQAFDTLTQMEETAKQRKQQIGNTQQAFNEERYEMKGPERRLPVQTTSDPFNAQAREMERLGLQMPPSEIAPHWWQMAAVEPVVDPRSPKFLRSARMRGALVERLTAGMDKATAKKAAVVLAKDLEVLSRESIGPRPLSAEYKLPDGRIVDIGDLLEEVKNDPKFAAAPKPGARTPYQEMVAETIGETYKAYGIKAGEVATLKHLELEAKRIADNLERDNADILARHAAEASLRGDIPFQATYANPTAAAEIILGNPAQFGLTPEQAAALHKTLTTQYATTPELVKKFMQRGAEQGIIAGGAPAYMKKGLAEALNEHLAVNYAKDLLSDSERVITDASRRAKENLTSLSYATKFANDVSNQTLQWISRGVNPITYRNKLKATADRWTAIADGAPADPYELQRQRSILKTGKLDTDMLTIEGKRTLHHGPTSGTPMEKLRRVARAAYAKSDSLPKLEESIANYDYMFDQLGRLGDGKQIVMETGPNVMATITRKNGVLEMNGKPFSPEALSDLVAKNAVQSALRKFVDHGDVNTMISSARRGSATGLVTPFLTWAWAVKDIPGIKSGVLGAVMFNDGPIWATNDAALQRGQWERAVKTSVRRSAINGAGWEALGDHTDDELRKTFGRAATPVARALGGDPLSEDVFDLARYDWMAPSMALWRLGGKAAWALKDGIDQAMHGDFPGTTHARLGSFKRADAKVLRAWSHMETGKGTEQDVLDLVGFGGGIVAPILREYYKPSGEGNWGNAAWTMSRAIVGGTPSDIANVAMAAYLPKASTRKLERPGKWSVDPATGEPLGKVRWESWMNFTLKKAIGLGFRTVNSMDEASAYLEKAEKHAEKTWVRPLQDATELAMAELATANGRYGPDSQQAAEAMAEVERLAEAKAIAKRAVTLTVVGYRKRIAKFLGARLATPRDAAERDATEMDAIRREVETEVEGLGGSGAETAP